MNPTCSDRAPERDTAGVQHDSSERKEMGNYPLRIVKLQAGQFNEIATGIYVEDLDFDSGTSTERYFWGGYDDGEISAEEYNAHIAEYIDDEKSRTLSDDDYLYYYDTLCDKLREWADEGGAKVYPMSRTFL